MGQKLSYKETMKTGLDVVFDILYMGKGKKYTKEQIYIFVCKKRKKDPPQTVLFEINITWDNFTIEMLLKH